MTSSDPTATGATVQDLLDGMDVFERMWRDADDRVRYPQVPHPPGPRFHPGGFVTGRPVTVRLSGCEYIIRR